MKTTWAPCVLIAFFLQIATAPWISEARPEEPVQAPAPAAHAMRGKAPGEVRDDNGLKLKLVWCPPGFLTMQNGVRDTDLDNEDAGEGRVKVLLTKGYWLGKYEVTQSEWKEVMKTAPWKGAARKEAADCPATFIDWKDAVDFCRKLTEQERQAGRLPNDWEYALPTEAQWERACRARTETKFSFGDDESQLGDYAWFGDNTSDAGEIDVHQVGRKKANPWGLFDMHGNVWEWCRDSYTTKLPGGRDPDVQSDEKTEGAYRVVRGGSWNAGAAWCRSGFRNRNPAVYQCPDLGFRLALSSAR